MEGRNAHDGPHVTLKDTAQTKVDLTVSFFTAAGHVRQCQACGALSFPRQDPAIIVTVQSADGKSLLLARSSRHPPRLVRTERGLEPLLRVATPPFQPQSRRLTRPRRRSPLLLSSSHY